MGKGKTMSKLKITEIEQLITKLQKIRENARVSESNRMFAASLLAHYMTYKTLSNRQRIAAHNLIKHSKPKRKKRDPKDATYYLYAITADSKVKLGISTNPKKRLRAMQTGNGEHLKCIWTYNVGKGRDAAYKQEKKLHRFCNEYRTRGEWFTSECLPLLKEFKPKV
ncbi:coil containing protein [Vibrio phage 1.110.O._10N.261.52.C1]|nr:coil containing protein [Vibrio phage 1.110.O._10N.261.52.C1]